ncbi:MAG: RNA polymerase sigma factor [Candidatus Eremiobacteraeota bacterium]|nr:RNA polymerase sigma factor [Candidatus Eremiobacteraeota bacterium]
MAQPVPRELVEAARSGDSGEIELLLKAVWPDACRLSYAVLGDWQAAQDAAQESCVIVYRTISSLRDPAAFRAWFYRIVVREASSLRSRRIESPFENEPARELEDPTASLDVWRSLATLPAHLREVVVLYYFEDLTSREVASVLGIHDGAVRFRLMTARRQLRALLGDVFDEKTACNNEVTTNAI